MKYSDKEIISTIQDGSHRLDPYIRFLYSANFRKINTYIRANRGQEENTEEVMQQGLIKLIESIETKKFKEQSSLGSYFYAICRNLWIDQQRKESKFTAISDHADEIPELEGVDPLGFLINEDIKTKVQALLAEIDEKCSKVLIWSDVDGRPMKWVAKALGYTLQAAMNKKSKCRKSIKAKILENPVYRQLAQEIISYN